MSPTPKTAAVDFILSSPLAHLFPRLRKRFWLEGSNIVIVAPDHPLLEPPALRGLYQRVVVDRGFRNRRRDISHVEQKQVDGNLGPLRCRRYDEVGVKVRRAAEAAHSQ